ncbi:glycosyltransferase [Pelagibacteraceae bacterium]|nr:glycosyltransferase [Pelagibacteraceae bacterium]
MKKKIFSSLTSISVVVPFYNEQNRLHFAFKNIETICRNTFFQKIEIIFVDDGSSDGSVKKIINFFKIIKKKNFSKNRKLKLIKLIKNRGKGFALKKGCLTAKNNWILTTDVDFSVPIIFLARWIKLNYISSQYNVYFGSRTHTKSIVKSSTHRLIIGKVFRLLISIFLGIKIKDTQCGFKLYEKLCAKKIFSKLTMYGFDHDLQIVLIAKKMNIKIRELPVIWKHINQSKLNLIKDSLKMLIGIFKLSFKK